MGKGLDSTGPQHGMFITVHPHPPKANCQGPPRRGSMVVEAFILCPNS